MWGPAVASQIVLSLRALISQIPQHIAEHAVDRELSKVLLADKEF